MTGSMRLEADNIINDSDPIIHISPYNGQSISAAFTCVCKMLDIDGLSFHDLQHGAASDLYELAWNIPRVAGAKGQRAWQTLQRYTHLHEQGDADKYQG